MVAFDKVIIIAALFGTVIVRAGGPLAFNAAGPLIWDNTAKIKYKIDKGPLRNAAPIIGPGDAEQVVKEAFQTWSAVPTANIQFEYSGLLNGDILTAEQYLMLQEDRASPNFVAFDKAGTIIDDLMGIGQSKHILGWARPITDGQHIVRFYSLMNGSLISSAAQIKPVMIHEFGHGIGLDHSQIQPGLANDGDWTNDRAVPIMFPTSTDSERSNPPHPRALHPDDVAWVSTLYPSPSRQKNYGEIKGKVIGPNGKALSGVNVVAIMATDQLYSRVSCVSDYLANGSGEFVLPVVPGTYTLHIEPILAPFVGGSSVGPHSRTPDGASFNTKVVVKDFPQSYDVVAGHEVSAVILAAEIQP